MGRENNRLASKNSFLKRSSGMTLVEIIVVLAIFMILVILSYLAFKPRFQLSKARDARRKADLKTISNALEDYLGDNLCYPDGSEINNCNPGDGLKPYLNKIPCDPLTSTSYFYDRLECKKYVLYSTLEIEEDVVDYGAGNYAVSSPNLRIIPTVMVTPTSLPGPTEVLPTNTPMPTTGPTSQPSVGPTSQPSVTSTPVGPTPTIDYQHAFFGCRSGVCVPLDSPPCMPNYQGYPDCLGLCGSPEDPKNECH